MKISLTELRRIIKEALEALPDQHAGEMWNDIVSLIKDDTKESVSTAEFKEIFDRYHPGVYRNTKVLHFLLLCVKYATMHRKLLNAASNDKTMIARINKLLDDGLPDLRAEFDVLIGSLHDNREDDY